MVPLSLCGAEIAPFGDGPFEDQTCDLPFRALIPLVNLQGGLLGPGEFAAGDIMHFRLAKLSRGLKFRGAQFQWGIDSVPHVGDFDNGLALRTIGTVRLALVTYPVTPDADAPVITELPNLFSNEEDKPAACDILWRTETLWDFQSYDTANLADIVGFADIQSAGAAPLEHRVRVKTRRNLKETMGIGLALNYVNPPGLAAFMTAAGVQPDDAPIFAFHLYGFAAVQNWRS